MQPSPELIQRWKTAYEMRQAGATYKQIAEHLGKGVQRVFVYCSRYPDYIMQPGQGKTTAELVDAMVAIIRQKRQICIRDLSRAMGMTRNKTESLLVNAEAMGYKLAEDQYTILSICELMVDVDWTIIGNQDYVRGRSRLGSGGHRRQS